MVYILYAGLLCITGLVTLTWMVAQRKLLSEPILGCEAISCISFSIHRSLSSIYQFTWLNTALVIFCVVSYILKFTVHKVPQSEALCSNPGLLCFPMPAVSSNIAVRHCEDIVIFWEWECLMYCVIQLTVIPARSSRVPPIGWPCFQVGLEDVWCSWGPGASSLHWKISDLALLDNSSLNEKNWWDGLWRWIVHVLLALETPAEFVIHRVTCPPHILGKNDDFWPIALAWSLNFGAPQINHLAPQSLVQLCLRFQPCVN